MNRHNHERGGASLFVVIFATILLSIITVNFLTLMLSNQRRAIDDELSRGAYDSALAGVEDAKRVILKSRTGGIAGQQALNAMANGKCTTIQDADVLGAGGSVDKKEVFLASKTGSREGFNQAYTCVVINPDSPDYKAALQAQESVIIPLHPVADVKSVQIEWHRSEDGSLAGWRDANVSSMTLPVSAGPLWAGPAMMRGQFMTPGGSIQLDQLDRVDQSGTLFLYPKSLMGSSTIMQQGLHRFAPSTDDTGWGSTGPTIAACNPLSLYYACSSKVALQNTIPAQSTLSFLRLTSIYKASSVRITMYDSNDKVVAFNGVQPIVDATGRANDIFRRVEARLSLIGQFEYPRYAVDTDGSLCKNFYVTQTTADRVGAGVCNP